MAQRQRNAPCRHAHIRLYHAKIKNNMTNDKETIDLRVIIKKLFSKKRLFVKTLAWTFCLSCIWILPQPRYYTTSVTLAPEMESAPSGGSLSSLASSFGLNLGNMVSSDAIYPTLYPDVMESSNFIVGLFNVKVKNEDGDLTTDYYTYLKDHQKISIYSVPFVWLKGMLAEMFPDDDNTDGLAGKANGNGTVDQFCLTKKQNSIVDMIRKNITCSVDKKTDVITITVQDQDKLICATMADTARVKLQDFIIEYRTRKAKTDLDYYTKLTNEAKKEYEDARKKYSDFADSNTNLSLASYKSKEEDLENDMQIKYNTYTTMNTQMQMAKAKVQERTPAFTILQGSSVPHKPAGPKRMLFVFAMMFVTFVGTIIYILKDDFINQLKNKNAQG